MEIESEVAEATRRTTLSEVRDLATIPVWSDSRPNAAGLLGVGRSHAYVMAARGDLPAISLGHRRVCLVPALLRLLGDEG
jgi:hypothetical protein